MTFEFHDALMYGEKKQGIFNTSTVGIAWKIRRIAIFIFFKNAMDSFLKRCQGHELTQITEICL